MKHGPKTILLKLLTILLSGSPYQWWTRQQVTAGLIPQRLQRSPGCVHVQHLLRATSAKSAELAGTRQLKIFVMVNIKKFPRGINSDPVISGASATASVQRAPGPGLKPQAPSFKHQAQIKIYNKHQAPSCKPQASSHKRQAPRFLNLDTFEND